MQGVFQRKYGVATTVDFELIKPDGVDLEIAAVHAAGDTKIMKDEGAEANTGSGFVDEGQGYSVALTAVEMQAARITIYVVDLTATKVWLDTTLVIETYGNASAQHAFDRDTAAEVMRGTDNAALDSVATEARLSELDAATGGKAANQIDLIKTEADKIALVNAGAGVAGSVIEEVENRATPVQVNTEVNDVISTDTQTEEAQGLPPLTPTIKQILMYLYMVLRNDSQATATERRILNDAAVVIAKGTMADDGTIFNQGKLATGP